jgi:uncharacterized protein
VASVDTKVVDNPERHRFEIYADGELAGFTAYRPQEREYAFTHTEIDPSYEGKGLGSVLARGALDEMRARGLGVLPYCPFVRRFVQRHPAYLDLVPPAMRGRFGLPPAQQRVGS